MSQFTIFDTDQYIFNQTQERYKQLIPTFQGYHHMGPRLQKRIIVKCRGICEQLKYIQDIEETGTTNENKTYKHCIVVAQMGCEVIHCPILTKHIDIDMIYRK